MRPADSLLCGRTYSSPPAAVQSTGPGNRCYPSTSGVREAKGSTHGREKRYGSVGLRKHKLDRGDDARRVDPSGEMKSISSEPTFATNLRDCGELERILWRQCEHGGARAKASGLGGRTVVLKLKT